MSSAYPVAYRSAVAREQGPAGVPFKGVGDFGGGFQKPPPAANDNWRPPPLPANDNIPKQVGKAVAYQAGKFVLRRLAPRLIPYLGWGLTALDIAEFLYHHYHHNSAIKATADSYVPYWNLEADCGDHGGTSQWGERSQYNLVCGTKSFISASNNNPASGIGTVLRSGVSWKQQIHWTASTFGFGFCTGGWPSQYWATPSSLAAAHPMQLPRRPYFIADNRTPNPDPRTDPMSTPVNHPEPRPNPKQRPIRVPRVPINPWRNPVEQPQRGPVPVVSPGQGTRVVTTPRGVVHEAVPPVRQPPKSGDKEVKLKTNIPHGVIRRVIDTVTEWKDLVDAIYGALPSQLRGQLYWQGLASTPEERALSIYLYWEQINWTIALQNIVENEIEDAIVGGIGKLARKTNQLRALFAPDGQSGIGVHTGPAL